jgi:hypothetical protein
MDYELIFFPLKKINKENIPCRPENNNTGGKKAAGIVLYFFCATNQGFPSLLLFSLLIFWH